MLEVLRTQILRRDEKIKKSEVKKWADALKRIFYWSDDVSSYWFETCFWDRFTKKTRLHHFKARLKSLAKNGGEVLKDQMQLKTSN